MNQIKEELKFEENSETFTFCGKQVVRGADGSVAVGQADAAKALEKVDVCPTRPRLLTTPCTSAKNSEIRGAIGAVGWTARQTRPDLLVATSLSAQSLSDPRVSHVAGASALIKAANRLGRGLQACVRQCC
jgi:hypothetical protein